MKKLLLVLLILLLPIVGYFSYGLINTKEDGPSKGGDSSKGLAVAKNLYDYTFKSAPVDLKSATSKMKRSLRDNREFMLDYFVDNARSSNTVRFIAKKYAGLFDLTHVVCSDTKGYQFSTFGKSSEFSEGVQLTENGFVLSSLDTLIEGASRISIGVSKEIPFSELKKLAEILEVDLLVLDGSRSVYTTLGAEIQNFGQKENGTVILNNEIYEENHLSVTDNVVLYCLKKSGE